MPQALPFLAGVVGAAAPAIGAATFGAYVAGVGFGATVGSFLTTTVLGRLLTSVALTALSRALQSKPKNKVSGIRSEQSLTGGTTPASFIIGRYATQGQFSAPPMSHGSAGGTPNAYLTYVIEVGDIPGQTLSEVIINGEPVTLGATPHADYGLPVEGKYSGYAWVKYYDGTQTVADPMLVAKYGADPDRPWGADMIGAGICYVVCTFRLNRQLFSGFPAVRFVIGGIPLYDPRLDGTVGGVGPQRWADQSTWLSSENVAVQAYNILRGISLPGGHVWGGNAVISDLPLSEWFAAMNASDASISLSGAGTEPAYRTSYEIYVSDEPADVLEELFRACSGQIAEIGGIWKAQIGAPRLPVFFITDDDLNVSEAKSFDPFPAPSEVYNGVQASYPAPDALWQSTDAPPLYNATYEAEDGGQRAVANLSLPAAPYPDQVQRLMRAYVEDNRRMRRHTITLPPEGIPLEPLDTILWTSTVNGYSAKEFEIAVLADPLVMSRPKATIRERDGSDYEWNIGLEIPVSFPSTTVTPPAPYTIPTWSFAKTTITDATGGDRRPALSVTWGTAGLDDISGVTHEVRVQATAAAVSVGIFADFASGVGIISDGILPNTAYQARIKPIATSGRAATWTAWKTATTDNVGLTPDDLATEVWTKIDADAAVTASGLITTYDINTMAPFQQAVTDAYGSLTQPTPLDARIITIEGTVQGNIGDIDKIDTDLKTNLPVVQGSEDAIDTLNERLIEMMLAQRKLGTNMADAGIYVDPATGSIKLEATARIDTGIAGLQLSMDAANAEISTRVTYSTLSDELTKLVLDPDRIPDLVDITGRVSTVEVTLDGLDGRFAAYTLTAIVNSQGLTLTQAGLDIDSLNDAIALRVTTSIFDAVETRVTQAEQVLVTLDGARISQSVLDVSAAKDDLDDLAEKSISDLLAARKNNKKWRADLAYARQDFKALSDDNGAAVASITLEIGVFKADTAAQFKSEALTRVTDNAALSQQITSLEVVTTTQTASLAEINRVEADSASANARALNQIQIDLNGAGGVAQALTTLEGRVDTNDGILEVSSTERTSLFVGVGDAEDLAAEGGLRALLEGKDARRLSRSGLAQAREDLTAKVIEDVSAEAAKRVELDAVMKSAIARLDSDLKVVTTDGKASAQSLVTLGVSLGTTDAKIESVLQLTATGATLFGQWYDKIEGDVYDPVTGLPAVHGKISSVYTLDVNNDPVFGASVMGQWYQKIEGDVYNPTTGLPAAYGRITDIEDLNVGSGKAVVTRFLSLEGAVNDSATGLVKAHARTTDVETLSVSESTALLQHIRVMEAAVGGDLVNSAPDNRIKNDNMWTRGSEWTFNAIADHVDYQSDGTFQFASGTLTGNSTYVTGSKFAVVEGETYLAGFQSRRIATSGQYEARASVRWRDAADAIISSTALKPGIRTSGGVKTYSEEIVAPAGARHAEFRFYAYRTATDTDFTAGSPSVERISGVVQAARAAIDQINTVSASSTSALALDYVGLKGEVNDPTTGLAKSHAEITAIKGLSVDAGTVLGQFKTKIEAQVGGDGANLVPDNEISTTLYWSLGTGWGLSANTPLGNMKSRGVLTYNVANDAGVSWSSIGDTWLFPVQQLQVYAVSLQTQSSAGYLVRARIRWEDKDGVLVSFATVINTTVASSLVQTFAIELTAPANAKRALVRVEFDRDATSAGVISVGGLTVQRVGEALAQTRGRVDDIVNFNLDGSSVLFNKLTGVSTEVFGPDGISGLKATSTLHQSSIDGIKAGFSLITDNNGHISGIKSTSDLADGVNASSDLLFSADKMLFMGETYSVGTVAVTNGSKIITGSGTLWSSSVAANNWFTGPDGRSYQIASVASNTSLTLVKNYKGQTAASGLYGIASGNPLLVIYTVDTVVSGVLIPKGVYLADAMIRNGVIGRAQITDVLQSDNYAENSKGLPTQGVKIDFKNDLIKLAGPVIARNFDIAKGSFVYSGGIGSNGSVDLQWINTGIRIGDDDVWQLADRTFLAKARISPTTASGASVNSIWAASGVEVFQAFAWNGAQNWNATTKPALAYPWMYDPPTLVDPPWATGKLQRIFLNVRAFTHSIVANAPITISWEISEVT